MGKDTELLEAARNGNLSIVEKILNQKSKRSGPLASLRRGPGANVQDSSGYSALHHAALNGHNDIIRLLLSHDASPNLPDARGSSPLHLAAWAGHQDIVKLFLTQPNRPANPNLQTIENETPLHCAARHGHTGALTTLLAHGADPNVKNNRNETPLDLAAQYGRLQAVQMLIRAHPELLLPFKINSIKNLQINDINCGGGGGSSSSGGGCGSSNISNGSNYNRYNSKLLNNSGNSVNSSKSPSFIQHLTENNDITQIVNHSPLHLASRNGHKNVVEVLLAAGINVNLLTPSGTALHEAALCGKDIVVRTLLDYGADLDATDCDGRTALDILEEFPPHVTKGIVSVINNHRNSMLYDSESDDIHRDNSIIYHQNNKNYNITATTPMSLGSSYENNRGCSPVRNYSHHDITTSPSSSMGSLGPPSPRQRTSTGDLPDFYITMTPIKNNQIAPKKPPRRNLYISPTHLSLSSPSGNSETNNYCDDIIGIVTTSNKNIGNNNGYGRINQHHSSSSSLSTNNQYNHHSRHHYYDQQQYHQNNSVSFDTSNSCNNIKPLSQKQNAGYEYVYMARTGPKIDEKLNNRSKSVDQYVDMNIQANELQQNEQKPKPAPRNLLANVSYENTTLKSYNPNRKLKRNRESYESFNIDFNKEKLNYDNIKNYPQSPTNYQQPPTPEHPPPPPSQAEKFIHDRIRPLSQVGDDYQKLAFITTTKNISNTGTL